MKTRSLISLALLIAMTPILSAVDAPARLMRKDKSHDDVLMLSYRKGTATYKMKKNDLNIANVPVSDLDSIYFYEPPIFAEAMALYQGRNYAEAKKKFIACEKAFKKVDTAPNNYGTLAGFYVLECSRRQFDLSALSSEQEKFRKEGLTRETQLQQLEVNAFWEAVRSKSWERLDRLAQGWQKRKVTGSQRAQIAYCHGMALEQLAKKNPKRMTEALNAYNRALSADFTASHEIVVAAASSALRIYNSNPKVQHAMKLWGTEDESKGSSGYQFLLEANTLTKLYLQAGWDVDKPLTPEYKAFLNYEKPKEK